MLWILWIVLGLVALLTAAFIVMWLVGRRLPLDHVCSAELDLNQPAAAVWQTIANIADYPKWCRINKVQRLDDKDGQEVWRQHFGRNSVVTRTTRSEPPTAFQQTIEDDAKYFSGTWTYKLSDRPGAAPGDPEALSTTCTVRLTEHGRVIPAIPRFFMHYLIDPAMYLKGQLRALADKFGAPPAIRVITKPGRGKTGETPVT